jgi:hypothetical protein
VSEFVRGGKSKAGSVIRHTGTCKVSAMYRHRQEPDLRAHDEAENKGLKTRIRIWDNMRYTSQRHNR